MKAIVGAFNQEKALAGAFSVIGDCENFAEGSFAALYEIPQTTPTLFLEVLQLKSSSFSNCLHECTWLDYWITVLPHPAAAEMLDVVTTSTQLVS